jgi:segregation and condensation protein A
MAVFKISLPDFEGPLDLLLFFIRRDELDIYDIPIAHITKEFLDYIHLMQLLDLDLAGEFIVMAATLMQIKARMLLPSAASEESEEEADPRAELTRRLLEYKRFKEAAEELQHFELDQRERYFRALFKHDIRRADSDDEEALPRDVTMFDLIRAFRKALIGIPQKSVHEIRTIPYSIEDQGMFLMSFFRERHEYNFLEIIGHMQEKIQLIVTFIALLELIRAHRVRIVTKSEFNSFRIIRAQQADIA